MSRTSFANEQYSLAFGVDHAIGTFFTIYGPEIDGPGDRRLLANYSARFGLSIGDPEDEVPKPLDPVVAKAVAWHKGKTGSLDQLDVTRIASHLGLNSKELVKQLYRLWD